MTISPAHPTGNVVGGFDGARAAEAAGRRIAAQVLTPAVAASANPVEAMAQAALPHLREIGVAAEIVRSRRDCLVVRSAAANPVGAADACVLVAAWLGALPGVAFGLPGTVAESTCSTRGSRTCMHTLMWRAPSGNGSAPPGPVELPATLSPDPGGAVPEPSSGASSPIPIPETPAMAPAASPVAAPAAPPVYVPPPAGWRQEPVRQPSPAPGSALPSPWSPTPVPAPPLRVPPGAGYATGSGPGGRPEPTAGWDIEDLDHDGREATRRWGWVRRRAWIVALGVLAGALGGFVAGSRGGAGYSATAVLEVKSGAVTSVAASANGAEVLAVTYAALIPDDQSLLSEVGRHTHLGSATVSRRLDVQAVAGTSLIDVHFSASTSASAITGAIDVARVLTSSTPPSRAIAAGSISLVSTPHSAARSGSLHKFGLPIGVVLGLAIGAGGALVAERADRRVDDIDALSAAAGCSATMIPGGISTAELARALARTGDEPVTVVPLRRAQEAAARELARDLGRSWPLQNRGGMAVGTTFETSPESLSDGAGQVVLVVGTGERARIIEEAAERLRLLEREPVWAVLVRSGASESFADDGS